MALFDIHILPPAQRAANEVRRIANQQFTQLAQSGTAGFNLIWKNATAGPLDILAALGVDAKAVFMLANLNGETIVQAATLVNSTAPITPTIPPGYTLTFNADGSVTPTYVDPTPSPTPTPTPTP